MWELSVGQKGVVDAELAELVHDVAEALRGRRRVDAVVLEELDGDREELGVERL
jgi:hypothetical protein